MRTRKVCEIAGIPKSAYYFNCKNGNKEIEVMKVIPLIERLPEKMRERAGSKTKSEKTKQRSGIAISHKRMARICREYGLLAENRAKKHPNGYYSNRKEERKNLPMNMLNREFASNEPFEKLVTDVSYFKTQSGWLYFSPVMDLYSRKILCYSISKNNDMALVNDMLDKLDSFRIRNGLIHSDQGVLCTSKEYRKRPEGNGFVRSMSRRANCWDNACIEHFFGTPKVESGYDEMLKEKVLSYEKTKHLIEDFVSYCNNERIQKNLGWKTPSGFAA